MLTGAGGVRRGAAHAWVLGGVLGIVLTGCSSGPETDTPPPTASAVTTAGAVAKSGGIIGSAGSACALPVTFDVAEGWKAKAVRSGTAKTPSAQDSKSPGAGARELADALLRQGPVTAVCEIDAKPAGNIGFLRVWTAGPGRDDARTVLGKFVAAEDGAGKARYRAFTAGGLDGAQVGYLVTNEFLDEPKKESALAVVTRRGPVVLHLGGLDSEEHEQMLPAFELAARTLRGS